MEYIFIGIYNYKETIINKIKKDMKEKSEFEKDLDRIAANLKRKLHEFNEHFTTKYAKELCDFGFSKNMMKIWEKEWNEYNRTHK